MEGTLGGTSPAGPRVSASPPSPPRDLGLQAAGWRWNAKGERTCSVAKIWSQGQEGCRCQWQTDACEPGGGGGVSQGYDSGYDGVILEGRDAPRSRVSSFPKGLSW